MTLADLAKRIAAQLKLKSSVVQAVLESKKTDLPQTAVAQITEAARTLIHEELMRLDARRQIQDKPHPSRRPQKHPPRKAGRA